MGAFLVSVVWSSVWVYGSSYCMSLVEVSRLECLLNWQRSFLHYKKLSVIFFFCPMLFTIFNSNLIWLDNLGENNESPINLKCYESCWCLALFIFALNLSSVWARPKTVLGVMSAQSAHVLAHTPMRLVSQVFTWHMISLGSRHRLSARVKKTPSQAAYQTVALKRAFMFSLVLAF